MSPIPYTWMGIFALGVLWLNCVLIALDALGHLKRVRAGRTAHIPAGAKIERCQISIGQERQPLATRHVEWVGRALRNKKEVVLRESRSTIETNFLEVQSIGGAQIDASKPPAVWIRAVDAAPDNEFDQILAQASTQKGARGEHRSELAHGSTAFVVQQDGLALLIANEDPSAHYRKATIGIIAVLVVTLGGAALTTFLVFQPPVFTGALSLGGGVFGFLFFVLIQPITRSIRAFARNPNEQIYEFRWRNPT